MYLKRIYIENNGALKLLNIILQFGTNGSPHPVILVGENGSGKTNLLSIITDALFEAASNFYSDVLPTSGTGRSWFRKVGSATISANAHGSASILEFEDNGKTFFFNEKGGTVPPLEFRSRVPAGLHSAVRWEDNAEAQKIFDISADQAREIFEKGVFAFFPASRAETPHWLNREATNVAGFDVSPRYRDRIRKPIFVEQGLERFQQWLLAIILESRSDLNFQLTADGKFQPAPINVAQSLARQPILGLANVILRKIMADDSARFVWMGRHADQKLGIERNGSEILRSLDSLSGGQATLLAIFGTILRYGDVQQTAGGLDVSNISGICLVDEIDAHMHVDLQYRALPQLMQLFPRIQFIVSSHSPLFVLGMEQVFGAGGIQLTELPSGLVILAEAYSEFEKAFKALVRTNTFTEAITKLSEKTGGLLVLTEGETDPEYISTAAELLGKSALLNEIEIDWIGAKGANGSQAFFTGKDALNQALSMLRANPQFIRRRIVLLYDSDANKRDEIFGELYVRSLPLNRDNQVVQCGIENLLPENVITDDMYTEHERKKRDGTTVIVREIDKTKLCKHICQKRRDANDFNKFASVLGSLADLVAKREE